MMIGNVFVLTLFGTHDLSYMNIQSTHALVEREVSESASWLGSLGGFGA